VFESRHSDHMLAPSPPFSTRSAALLQWPAHNLAGCELVHSHLRSPLQLWALGCRGRGTNNGWIG
jgi:hypothetical protein